MASDKPALTVVLDAVRHLLIVSATGYVTWGLWLWHPVAALIGILPVYVFMLNVFGFLTLPFYAITAIGGKAREQAFLQKLAEDAKTRQAESVSD